MKIQLAVYTAIEGFDWQPGTSIPRVELNRYMEKIGRFPDILMERDRLPFGGAFVCDGRFVFYRFHVAERGDSHGRDALYCVLGRVPLADAKRLDMAAAFQTPEFAAPMRPIPSETEVPDREPPPDPASRAACETAVGGLGAVDDLGFYASFYGKGTFDCRLSGKAPNLVPRITSANPDIPEPYLRGRPDPFEALLNDPDAAARLRELSGDCSQRIRKLETANSDLSLLCEKLHARNRLLAAMLAALLGMTTLAAFALWWKCSSPDKTVEGGKTRSGQQAASGATNHPGVHVGEREM